MHTAADDFGQVHFVSLMLSKARGVVGAGFLLWIVAQGGGAALDFPDIGEIPAIEGVGI